MLIYRGFSAFMATQAARVLLSVLAQGFQVQFDLWLCQKYFLQGLSTRCLQRPIVVVHKCSHGGANLNRDQDEPSLFRSAGFANKPSLQQLAIDVNSNIQVITAISERCHVELRKRQAHL